MFWEGKRLHANNMLRQLLHEHYIPTLRGKPQEPLVSVNTCFTYHGAGEFLHQATENEIIPLVKPFIQLGAEVFIIDAGWYPGAPWQEWLGDWHYAKEKYPRGFQPISKPLADAGISFGLWFAPEHLSKTAPLLREHPEWVRQQAPGSGGTLRVELPEAREWFLKQVDELVEKEGMSCYRQDFYGAYADLYKDEPENRRGITETEHVMGLYTLIDTIRQRHPNLVMEAAIGAPRLDLETLSRFHWHQPVERWFNSESDQSTLYGTGLYLPGGMIIPYTQPVSDYGVWSSFTGQLSVAWHPLDTDFPMEQARHQVERYKRIRSLLSGDFYPLTPGSLDEGWIGYQFHRSDRDRGFALLFRRGSKNVPYPVNDHFRFSLRGLDPKSRYQVHFERSGRDEILTGEKLVQGRDLVLSEAPAAEMILYEPIK